MSKKALLLAYFMQKANGKSFCQGKSREMLTSELANKITSTLQLYQCPRHPIDAINRA